MKDKQNTITLNGKLYDAVTGKLIDDPTSPASPKTSPKHESAKPSPAKKHPKPKETTSKPPKERAVHHPHDTHRVRQHTKTLMRRAVKKPVRLAHKISDLQTSTPVSHNISPVDSLDIIGAKQIRSEHAQNVHRSHLVRRFASHDDQPSTVIKKVAKLSVRPAPDDEVIKVHTSAPLSEPSTTDLFSSALTGATSHQQAQVKHSKRQRAAKKLGVSVHVVHFGMITLAVLALGGFIAYQNASNIRVHLAGVDAGMHASLPGYRPAGFALDHTVQAFPGEVVLSFHSTSDNRNFKITQASVPQSTANGYISSLVVNSGQPYQALNQGNTTIYIYGAGNASWVKGNTWYSIDGNSSLSSSQLLHIADSI